MSQTSGAGLVSAGTPSLPVQDVVGRAGNGRSQHPQNPIRRSVSLPQCPRACLQVSQLEFLTRGESQTPLNLLSRKTFTAHAFTAGELHELPQSQDPASPGAVPPGRGLLPALPAGTPAQIHLQAAAVGKYLHHEVAVPSRPPRERGRPPADPQIV